MIPPSENLQKTSLENESQKVQKVINCVNSTQKEMSLPKTRYEPFFLKAMSDFIAFHKLPKDIPVPQGHIMPHKLLSYILDLMAHSMGDEKREQLVNELNDYKQGLPFDLR